MRRIGSLAKWLTSDRTLDSLAAEFANAVLEAIGGASLEMRLMSWRRSRRSNNGGGPIEPPPRAVYDEDGAGG